MVLMGDGYLWLDGKAVERKIGEEDRGAVFISREKVGRGGVRGGGE